MSENNRNRKSSYDAGDNWDQNQGSRYDQRRQYNPQQGRNYPTHNQRQQYGNQYDNQYENTGSSYDDRGQFRYGSNFENENRYNRQHNQGGMGQQGSNYGTNYGASYDSRRQDEYDGGYGNAYGQSGQYDRRHEYQSGYGNMGGNYGNTQGTSGAYGNYGESRGWGNQYNQSQQFRGDGYRGEDRGWWDKTRDEVSSWFGDEDAERRRRHDHLVSGQHRGKGPRDYRRSDDRIREDVCDRLSDDSYVDASNIDVKVNGCEVTLSGTVESREAKRRAEDIVESISGVDNVQNHLRVTHLADSHAEGLRTPVSRTKSE